jgi:cytochrome c-type biogenesis protein CcmE
MLPMSTNLDRELESAIAEADDIDSAALPPPAHTEARRRNTGLLVMLLALVAALVTLFLFGFNGAAVYAMSVDQLAASSRNFVGRKVRVEGELVPGTLVRRDQPCEYRFTLHKDQVELPVRYAQCVIPDTFRDMPGGGVQVTVEGALSAEGDFRASLVMAKCASKYDPSTHRLRQADGLPIN